MKGPGLFFCHILECKAVNKLKPKDFLINNLLTDLLLQLQPFLVFLLLLCYQTYIIFY